MCCAGYQYLVAVFFLIVFPINILIRSFASTITILYAWKNAGTVQLRLSTFLLTSGLHPCIPRSDLGIYLLWCHKISEPKDS